MIAVVTMCSSGRLEHARRQQATVRRFAPDALRIVVWLDADGLPSEDDVPELDGAMIVPVAPGDQGLRLAAGRNAGAAAAIAAGAGLLVFLDADCLAGPETLELYAGASLRSPDALLCGPVTYLPETVQFDSALADEAAFEGVTAPHPARPAPPRGSLRPAPPAEYPLFWSLSFAATSSTWSALGGFDEAYEGYGGEDTDFAFRARDQGIPLVWVGGAHAFHQYHPTSSPPWQHLDDILRNGAIFAAKWGEWPMTGWLTAFAAAGAIVHGDSGWRRVEHTSPERAEAAADD